MPGDSSKTIQKEGEYTRNWVRAQVMASNKFFSAPEHKELGKLLFGEAKQILDALYSSPQIDVIALHKKSKIILDSLNAMPQQYLGIHKAYDLALAFAHRLGRTPLGKKYPDILAFYTQILIDEESPNPGLLYACLKQLQEEGYWEKVKVSQYAERSALHAETYFLEKESGVYNLNKGDDKSHHQYMSAKKQQITHLRQLAAK